MRTRPERRATILALATLLAFAAPSGRAAVTFTGPELLGRPTDTSVTLNVVADTALDAYVEYGTSPGVYTGQTAVGSAAADTPLVFVMDGLQADTRYWYRLRFRPAGGGAFSARPEHPFHTQRAPHGAFTFTVQSDSHLYDRKCYPDLYTVALQNQAADAPDFVFDLGDTFGDDHNPYTITAAELDALHLAQRPYLGIVGASSPVFLVLGNHEGEAGYYIDLTPPDNLAINGTLARQKYYANPVPDHFYTGNASPEAYGVGLPQDYYAFRWGDALFVALDAYRFEPLDPKVTGNLWDWTLGRTQYDWFRATLENSRARYTFVFLHHVLGQTRGAVTWAGKFEWGGLGGSGSYDFDVRRPGWGKPIHQVMADNHVTAVFQGHDHLYAQETLDGILYVETPMPSDGTYHVGDVNASYYTGVTINDSGHLRVSVSPARTTIDYVRAWRPGEGTNREVAASTAIASPIPIAAFGASTLTPPVGTPVTFTDQSTNGAAAWSWDFGDGGTSSLEDPTHVYAAGGTYVVTLTASNASGSDTTTRQLTACPLLASPTAITGVRRSGATAVLDVDDCCNPAADVSGYNVYRTGSAALPITSWTLAASNAVDGDPARAGIQWTDTSGDGAAGAAIYYRVAAFNAVCSVEGPP